VPSFRLGELSMRLVPWWARYRRGLCWSAVCGMAVVAIGRWYTALFLLLFSSEGRAAVDLLQRWNETRRWFAGLPFSSLPWNMAYPPATYIVLWPALGWLSQTAVRWLWAGLLLASLAWLTVLLVRASGAERIEERALWVSLVLSSQATTLVIANGQLAILVMPALIVGVLLSFRRPRQARTDLAIAGLGLFGLVKPTIAAPFCWSYLFCAPTLWPGALLGAGYIALTLAAAAFQPLSLRDLASQYMESTRGFDAGWGYGSLHSLFGLHGLHQWVAPVALTALAGLGIWVYCHRRSDPWLILSVTALVARFWTYHQIYDDLLILVPLAFLSRWVRDRRGGRALRTAVSTVVAAAAFVLVAPGRWFFFSDGAEPVINTIRTCTWLALLGAVLLVSGSARAPVTDLSPVTPD
jgi:hypothetical protein